MQVLVSNIATTARRGLVSIFDAGWDYLPPDKATALSQFGREWANEQQSKKRVEFWKRHSMRILMPHSWMQLLGTLAALSGGICASAFLACLLMVSAGMASLGVVAVITATSVACVIMAVTAFFPLLAILAVSAAVSTSCITGGVAIACLHEVLQWLNLVPPRSTTSRHTSTSNAGNRTGPLGFSSDQPDAISAQGDVDMRPLLPSEMPVSDVPAIDMALTDRRPAKVATSTTTSVTPRLLMEDNDSKAGQPRTFRSNSSWFTAEAQVGRSHPSPSTGGSTQRVLEGPATVSEPGAARPVEYGVAAARSDVFQGVPGSSATGNTVYSGEDFSSMVGASSSATLGVSPVSAHSAGIDSVATDSFLSKDSCSTQNAVDQASERMDSGGDGGTAKRQSAQPVRQRTSGRGRRQLPRPTPSDVSSTGQVSVIDIMDQRFMGGF